MGYSPRRLPGSMQALAASTAAWAAASTTASSAAAAAGLATQCASSPRVHIGTGSTTMQHRAHRPLQRHGWAGPVPPSAGSVLASERARQRRLVAAAAAEVCLELVEGGQQAAPLVQQAKGPPAGNAALPTEEPPSLLLRSQQVAAEARDQHAAPEPCIVEQLSQLPQQVQQAQQAFQLPVPNLGYTCLNVQLQQERGIRTNRTCWRRTFEAHGLPHVSSLALANCRDLLAIVGWNAAHGVHFFRIPSALFPWEAEYELEQLPDFEEIAATLAAVGAAARAAHQRLTCHPSHYVQLASPDEGLRARSLRHLEHNARVFDLMGYAPSHHNKINVHVGGTYGCKRRALQRFAASLDRLSPGCRSRLTVENDDQPSKFTVADLLPLHSMAGVPLVFDFLHHALVPGGMSEGGALAAALATWPAGVRPVVHYSEPSENPALARRAHSKMLTQPFDLYGRDADVDVMLEAKGMDRALLFYRDELLLGRKTHTVPPPRRRVG